MSKMKGLFEQDQSGAVKDTSVVDFIVGIILVGMGLYSIFKNTSIGVLWMNRLFGTSLPGGIVTLPILIGIVIIFLHHKSPIGWGILALGVVVLLIQIILSLRISFNTTSLLDYLLMFGGTFGGLGLLARALLR